MDISSQFKLAKNTFEEFKVFVVEQITANPIAAIAMAILFPIAIVVTGLWSIRKIRSLNQVKVHALTPTILAPTTSIPANATKNIEIDRTWNKKWIASGVLAFAGAGLAIYSYSQSPAAVTNMVKEFPNPFQSVVTNATSSIYNLVVENEPVLKVVSYIPSPFQLQSPANNAMSSIYESMNSILPAMPSVTPILNNSYTLFSGTRTTAKKVSIKAFFTVADEIRGFVTTGVLFATSRAIHQDSLKETFRNIKSKLETKTILSSLGVVGGTAAGVVSNLWHSHSIFEKTSMICTPLKKSATFAAINTVQQQITKNVGGLFNLLPGTIVLASSGIKRLFSHNDAAKNAANNQIIKASYGLAKTGVMTGIIMAANQGFSAIGKGNFDPSGHLMLKAAGLQGLVTAIYSAEDKVTRTALGAFAVCSVAADAPFLANTAGCYHTPLDMAAGAVLAVAAAKLANVIVNPIVEHVVTYLSKNNYASQNGADLIAKVEEQTINVPFLGDLGNNVLGDVTQSAVNQVPVNQVAEIAYNLSSESASDSSSWSSSTNSYGSSSSSVSASNSSSGSSSELASDSSSWSSSISGSASSSSAD